MQQSLRPPKDCMARVGRGYLRPTCPNSRPGVAREKNAPTGWSDALPYGVATRSPSGKSGSAGRPADDRRLSPLGERFLVTG
jgi:hypothetical protein